MLGNKTQDALKRFLLDTVLCSDTTITTAELNLLRVQIKAKLAELNTQVQKLDEKATAETFNSIMLTALTLKCVLSLTNKIERENETI